MKKIKPEYCALCEEKDLTNDYQEEYNPLATKGLTMTKQLAKEILDILNAVEINLGEHAEFYGEVSKSIVHLEKLIGEQNV